MPEKAMRPSLSNPQPSDGPVFRFAPSPNGLLHLGHARSALLNQEMASSNAGRLLLRIEDIDTARCTPEFEAAIYRDLAWLGIRWEEPVRRQSEHFDLYRDALDRLVARDLAYPAFLTRGDVRAMVTAAEAAGKNWPRDPDGAPLYPQEERLMGRAERDRLIESGARHAWRLNMDRAIEAAGGPLHWRETDASGEVAAIAANPALWGDFVLSRSDAPSSYHLSVVLDDALQGVTHVVRGQDLFHATAAHRLLQILLDLPEPAYRHHPLVLRPDGRKLSKSHGDTGIANLRDAGVTPQKIRAMVL